MIVSLVNDLLCSKTSAFYLPLGSRCRIYTLPCRVAQSYTIAPHALTREGSVSERGSLTPLSSSACHRSCSFETQGSTSRKSSRLVTLLVFHAEDVVRTILAANDLISPLSIYPPWPPLNSHVCPNLHLVVIHHLIPSPPGGYTENQSLDYDSLTPLSSFPCGPCTVP